MKHGTLQATFVAILLLPVIARADDFTTTTGKKYSGSVDRIEPDGILLITDDGIQKVYFTELPATVAAKYGYSPTAAVSYQQAEQQSAAQRQADALQIQSQQEQAAQAASDQQRAAAAVVRAAQVTQAFDNPLDHAATQSIHGTVIQRTTDGFIVDAKWGKTHTVFVEMDASLSNLYDGNPIETPVVQDGNYSYTMTDGSESVIPQLKVGQ